MNDFSQGLSLTDAALKRCFDLVVALIGFIGLWWLILLAFLAAMVENRGNGFFIQDRVGKGGRLFKVIKIRTMKPVQGFHKIVILDAFQLGTLRCCQFGHPSKQWLRIRKGTSMFL